MPEGECLYPLLNLQVKYIFSGPLKHTHRGDIQNFYCHLSRKKGSHCQAVLRVIYNAENEDVYVERNTIEHDHEVSEDASNLNEDVKEFIRQRMERMTAYPIWLELSVSTTIDTCRAHLT